MNRKYVFSLVIILALALSLWLAAPAQAAPEATCIWTGVGGDGLWGTSSNWSGCTGGGVPASTDSVLLDNSIVSGNYSVTLPAGAVTTTVVSLTITPSAGNNITLIVPSTNTINPGLSVGDNTSGTDDLILNNGAQLINSTGTGSGYGVSLPSSLDTFRINNGGRYQHNNIRSHADLVARLSTASGTETGVFEFNVPGSGSYAISLSGRNYGTLELKGTRTYTGSGASALSVRGSLIIWTGVTFAPTLTAPINIAGNWTNNGTFTPGTTSVILNGTSAQAIGGSSATTFYNLTVNNLAGVTLNQSITVNQRLDLTGDITTGSNTVNLAASAITTGSGDVFGTTRRNHAFTSGTPYSFGNPDVQLTFTGGTMPSDVSVILAAARPYAYAANRTYSISSDGSGWSATLRLHYEDAELNLVNGATENNLLVIRNESGVWKGKTSTRDTTANWVQTTGVTGFSDWGIAGNDPTAVDLIELHASVRPSLGPAAALAGVALLGLGVFAWQKSKRWA